MRPWLPPVALAVLAILAAPAASGAIQGTLYSHSFQVTAADAGGSVQVAGNPTVVDLSGFNDSPGSAHLTINATSLSMDLEGARYMQFDAGPAPVGGLDHERQPPEHSDFGAAIVRASIWDHQTNVFLVPVGETTVSLSAAEMVGSVPSESCRPHPFDFSYSRPALCPDTGASSFAATGGTMTAEGDFIVHLWSWHGSVDSGGEVTPFWSGLQKTENSTTLLGKTEGEVESHSLFFHVKGRLDVQLAPGQVAELFTEFGQISSGRVEVAAKGKPPVRAEGEMLADRIGSIIAVTVRQGTVTSGGETLVVGQTAVAAEQQGASWDWRWAILGLCALPPAVVVARRRNARVHLRHARENLGLLNFHAAARHAEAALGHRRTHVEAGILGAIALIRSGDLDDARHFISALESKGKANPAALTYLQACMAAQAGDLRGARALLADCLAGDPRYEAEAAANPILQPLGAFGKRGKPPSEAYT